MTVFIAPGHQDVLAYEARLNAINNSKSDQRYAAIWARNERESRLLQLPAELRLQIFEYVIGSWVIYTDLSWDHMQSSFTYRCLEDIQPCVDYYRDNFRPVYHAYSSPRPSVPLDSSITVLSTVCRQLYRETAALPFKNFIWAFDNAFTLEQFLRVETKTNSHHKRAIRTVLVPSPGPYRTSEQTLVDLRTILLAGCSSSNFNEFNPPSRSIYPSATTALTLKKGKVSNMWEWNDQCATFAKDLFDMSAFHKRKRLSADE